MNVTALGTFYEFIKEGLLSEDPVPQIFIDIER